MDIVFSANNREEIIVFPYTPDGMELSQEQDVEEFDGLSRKLLLIGKMGLRELHIEGYWFLHNPAWVNRLSLRNKPRDYINFFKKWREKLVPIRCVITKKDGNEIVNMACIITGFSYSFNTAGDVKYSLNLKEYVFVKV